MFHWTLASCSFTPTASFIWKSGNKLAGILLRKRKGEIESMRQGNDVLSWTSDAPLYKSLCSDRRKQQYAWLCWVTSACRKNLTLLCHTKRWLHWLTTLKWASNLRSGGIHRYKICFLPHFKYKLWLRVFFFYAHFSNINVPAVVSSQQRHCIWLNCEGGRSIITLLPPPGWSVVMTKGCGGSKHRTKALSSWLPTETGSKTA